MKPLCASNQCFWAKLSRSTVYYAVQGFVLSVDGTLRCDHSNESCWKALSRSDVCFNILENCNLDFNYEFASLLLHCPLWISGGGQVKFWQKLGALRLCQKAFSSTWHWVDEQNTLACTSNFKNEKDETSSYVQFSRQSFILTLPEVNSGKYELWWTYMKFLFVSLLWQLKTLQTFVSLQNMSLPAFFDLLKSGQSFHIQHFILPV